MPFFEKCAPKNAPMPLISRIGPAGDFWLIAMPSAVLRKGKSTI